DTREPFQRVVDLDQAVRFARRLTGFVQRDRAHPAAALVALPGTAVVGEYAAHQAGGDGEKMGTVLPGDVRVDEPCESLVDQRGRLQRMAAALGAERPRRDPTQILVDHRREPLEGRLVAGTPVMQ